jgi:predicted HicB family RNase H-like nuclease
MKRVNIGIDEETHKRAKVISVLKGITLNEYLEHAIAEALKKEGKNIKIP